MSKLAYVNGAYTPHRAAAIHIEDRGYQFSDGVYEVWAVANGRLCDSEGHLRRLARSLGELRIERPMDDRALLVVLAEIIRRNRIKNGLVYLQITRGVAPRDHGFPKDTPPSIVITAKSVNPKNAARAAKNGVAIISMKDERWARCDIKSISLLPNILAKQAARDKGGYEAWMVDEKGLVTEGSSSNAWIVTKDGVLVTRDLKANILSGITRAKVRELAAVHQLECEERPFSLAEAKEAAEAFITAATNVVIPVISLDGAPIGAGTPGPIARQLRDAYLHAGP